MSKGGGVDRWGAVSLGVLMIIVGLTFLYTPDLIGEIRAFIRDLKPVNITGNFWFVEPSGNHPTLYRAVAIFTFASGAWSAILGVIMVATHESTRRATGQFSGAVFSFGVGVTFIELIIALGGLILIVRASLNMVFTRPERI